MRSVEPLFVTVGFAKVSVTLLPFSIFGILSVIMLLLFTDAVPRYIYEPFALKFSLIGKVPTSLLCFKSVTAAYFLFISPEVVTVILSVSFASVMSFGEPSVTQFTPLNVYTALSDAITVAETVITHTMTIIIAISFFFMYLSPLLFNRDIK